MVRLAKKIRARMPLGPLSDLNFVEDEVSSLTQISYREIDADLGVHGE